MWSFFLHGYYYPNILFAVLIYLVLICLLTVYLFANFLFYLYSRIVDFIRKETIFALFLLLGLMILSRFGTAFLNDTKHAINPDNYYSTQVVGNDLFGSVTRWAYSLLDHKKIDPTQAYGGQTLAIITAPILLTFEHIGLCNRANKLSCNHILYRILTLSQLVLYTYFIWSIVKKKERRINAYLFFAIFLLGSVGGFGVERGNVDILFSIIVGLLLSWSRSKRRENHSLGHTVVIFLTCGLLTNGKILILPYIILMFFNTQYIVVAICAFVFGFVGISFIPSLFYGVSTSFMDPFVSVSTYNTPLFICYKFNHSLLSIPFSPLSCDSDETLSFMFALIIRIISYYILSIYVFFYTLRPIFLYIFSAVSQKWKHFKSLLVYAIRPKTKFFLMLMISTYITAIINLTPMWAAPYRAFYSLPIIFILLNETKDPETLNEIYLSMIFLCLSGLWVHVGFLGFGSLTIPEGIMNLFLVVHYYFLIKSSVTNFMKQIPKGIHI